MVLQDIFNLLSDSQKIQLVDVFGDLLPNGHYDGRDSIDVIYNNCHINGIYAQDNVLYIAID